MESFTFIPVSCEVVVQSIMALSEIEPGSLTAVILTNAEGETLPISYKNIDGPRAHKIYEYALDKMANTREGSLAYNTAHTMIAYLKEHRPDLQDYITQAESDKWEALIAEIEEDE